MINVVCILIKNDSDRGLRHQKLSSKVLLVHKTSQRGKKIQLGKKGQANKVQNTRNAGTLDTEDEN